MSKKPNYVFDDELCHWGIPGQRWRHRRYQNEDGSLTAEGREHYGYGDERSKAKISYNTQKYKADLKSRAKQEKATRSANEERHSIKENAKTMRIARKEQGKFDRLNKKEEAKLENQGREKLGKTKNMSDDDLQKAIDRLKLQAEYNKQYVLATQPNSALAKADRFFDGPTGKFVRDLAVQTLPNVANTATSKILESRLKYANKEDRDKAALDAEKARADIVKTKADTEKTLAEVADKSKGMSDLERRAKEADIRQKEAQAAFQKSNAWNTTKNVLGPDYEIYMAPDGQIRVRKKKP